jgi:predicted PurR-regulated permease PerM
MDKQINIPNNFYPIMKWAGIIIIIGGIKATSQIFLPILLALFISLMLLQPIHWLEKRKIPYTLAIILVLVSFSFIIFLIGETLGRSVNKFSQNLPEYKLRIEDYFETNSDTLDIFGIDITENNIFGSGPGKMMNFLLSSLDQVKQIVGKVFFIFLLTLFLLFELDSFPIKFNAIFSRTGNIKAKINLNRITINLRNYLGIKTLTSLATGVKYIYFY